MKRERKIYDPAFKTKAVQLSNERTNISELARELGIAVTLLYKWRKEYEEFGEGSFPGNGNSKHNYLVVENVLDRDFTVAVPSEVWVSDITYIHTKEGFLYLTTVIDLYDRKVIGWSLSGGMNTEDTSLAAWKMAVKNRKIADGLMFHSDRGVQYASKKFTNTLEFYGITRSMSRKGNCWDNAVAESFFKSLKTELIYGNKLISKERMELEVFHYIEVWYNKKRRHTTLNYQTIEEFNNQNKIYKNVA